MGVSNAVIDAESGSFSPRGTVSLIQSGRLVKVAQRDRPADPAARETRVEDRPTINRVHDKLFKTFREPYVHKVLRSHATDGSGLLTPDQLRSALERLHLGLDPAERERIVARVAPAEHGRVHYTELLRWLEVPQPLGGEDVALARGSSVPGPPTVRPGGGGHGGGDGGRGTYWNWRRHPQQKQTVPGLPDAVSGGSPEQAQADAALTALVASKLASSQPQKLRDVFRRLDADRNSVLDREEFARGVASLGIPASRAQLDRLFQLVDADGDGVIDYGEWAARFEDRGRREPPAQQYKATARHPAAAAEPPSASGGSPGTAAASPFAGTSGPSSSFAAAAAAAAAAPGPDEVAGALRHPLVLELARSLAGRGRGALAVFQRADGPRSGRLGLRELTRCCRELVPGIEEQQVAAVAAALEPYVPTFAGSPSAAAAATSTAAAAAAACGHVDYRSFVSGLLEAAPPHPRLLHSAPAGAAGGGAGGDGGEGGVGGGTLTRSLNPHTASPLAPSAHLRSLSAMGLSGCGGGAAAGDDDGNGVASPPALSVVPPDRTSLYDLHSVAIGPFLESLDRSAEAALSAAVGAATSTAPSGGGGASGSGAGHSGTALLPTMTRSVDMGTLRRSRLRQQQKGAAAAAEGGSGLGGGSQAPSHASGRFSRFWATRYADTRAVTEADPASAAAPAAEGVWVRKGENDAYLRFQGADREHRERRNQQLVLRYNNRSDIDSRYSAADDASGADEGRLAHMRALKQRYEERAEMTDRVRQSQADKAEACFFTRQPAHHEHQLEGANTPHRLYW